MGLFDSLGLGEVEADPNALPDGKWDGVVFKSEFVEKKNGGVSHVITYKVTDGDRAGAQRQEWFNLGDGAKKDESGKIVDIETPTMTEAQKSWYVKRWNDLGVELDAETAKNPGALVGKDVTFGTKKNGSYININFVELREGPTAAPEQSSGSIIGSL